MEACGLTQIQTAHLMQRFSNVAFAPSHKRPTTDDNVTSERVNEMIDATLELAQKVLSKYNATAIVTRTEEERETNNSIGTSVHLRITCPLDENMNSEEKEITTREALIAYINQEAPLLRPITVYTTLDGVAEVRLCLPSAQTADRLAWRMHRSKYLVRIPVMLAVLSLTMALGTLAMFYHHSNARHGHDEL